MSTSHLHLADAPKNASMYAFTCARCQHEELLHPVFLSDGRAYGTGCAAIMLGLVDEKAKPAAAKKALKAHGDELRELAEAVRAAARREFDLEVDRFDASLGHAGDHGAALASLGGFAGWNAAFKAWSA